MNEISNFDLSNGLGRPRHKSFWESRALFPKRALEKTSAFLFLLTFFLCASCCQRKKVASRYTARNFVQLKPFSAFLLAEGGAKEKLRKENAEERFRSLRRATAARGGSDKLSRKLEQSFFVWAHHRLASSPIKHNLSTINGSRRR